MILLINWFTLSVVALICFVAYELLSRKISVDSDNPQALSSIFNSIVTFMTPLLLLIEPLSIQKIQPLILFVTVIGLVIWGIFGRMEYFSHKYVDASTLSIITKLAPVLALSYAVIIFGETLNITKVLGMILILISNIGLVLLLSNKGIILGKGLKYALATTILLSIAWTIDKHISPYYGVAFFSFLTFGAPAIFNFFIPPLHLKDLQKELQRTNWKLILLAFINLIGYVALIKALMLGEVSKVTIISTATPPFVILFSVIFLKERSHLLAKLGLGIVTVLGIYMLR